MRRLFQFSLALRARDPLRRGRRTALSYGCAHRGARAPRASPHAAARRRCSEFGDVDDARRYLRNFDRGTEAARRRSDYLGELRQDLTYALRKLRTSPAFTITAVAHARARHRRERRDLLGGERRAAPPLPFPEPEQLAASLVGEPGRGQPPGRRSPLDLDDWRAQKQVIADVGGWFYQDDGGSGIDLTGAGEPQRLGAVVRHAGILLHARRAALAGRLPRDEEMVRGGPDRVVVLSHASGSASSGAARRDRRHAARSTASRTR